MQILHILRGIKLQREIIKELDEWKDQPQRLALLLRGARQVGKTYLVDQFAKTRFEHFVSINFELQREYIACFESLEPNKILKLISALGNHPIIPGKTLLFFDEIQECPNAISALRYFKEQMPELHVIGAGSLLEFTLNEPDFRMPVGRIQSLFLKPLSFYEFLHAAQHDALVSLIKEIRLGDEIPSVIHEKLLSLLREYMIIGGMPAVVGHYLQYNDLNQVQILQSSLLVTYRNDFGKYAKSTKHKYLQKLFEKTPGMIGQQFRYVKIDPDMQARDIKVAIDYLRDAGLIHTVYSSSASGLPLNAQINEKKFKLLFLDLGLAKCGMGLDADILMKKDLMLINQGMLVEQFVGQELLAYANRRQAGQLYYWERAQAGSMAEVDYLFTVDDQILPIEVKSGTSQRLKSMHLFLQEKKAPFGIRVSQNKFEHNQKVLSVPLYMIHELKRLALEALRAPV